MVMTAAPALKIESAKAESGAAMMIGTVARLAAELAVPSAMSPTGAAAVPSHLY
jgi:hypothetical protein